MLVGGLMRDYLGTVISAVERGEPLVSTWYGNGVEIFGALGLACIEPASLCAHFLNDEFIKKTQASSSSSMTCGLLRFGLTAVEQAYAPTPSAMVAMLQPCDGQAVLHELIKQQPEWCDVPTFALDAPYGNSDEDYRYFAGELRRLTSWLEQTTGRTMTEEKLRRACRETNRQYALFAEICELQHARPAPLASNLIPQALPTFIQHMTPCNPKTTLFLRVLAKQAASSVKKGVGALENERIRCYWLDIPYFVGEELWPWLAQTYGATVLNSTWGEARGSRGRAARGAGRSRAEAAGVAGALYSSVSWSRIATNSTNAWAAGESWRPFRVITRTCRRMTSRSINGIST